MNQAHVIVARSLHTRYSMLAINGCMPAASKHTCSVRKSPGHAGVNSDVHQPLHEAVSAIKAKLCD